MAVNPPQLVNVTCPACHTRYTAPVQNVIDVGRDPRLKSMLLQGRVNVGVCPSCGTAGMLSIPMAYHDPEKELLFCLVPQELRMDEASRQRVIGEMSRAVMNGLAADQRKGYLLRPREFLTFQTMLDTILEADGITKEMLEAQRGKVELIRRMLEVVDDPLRLAALISESEQQIDYELFTLLAIQITGAEQSNQTELSGKLLRLRQALLERTATGKKVAEQQQAVENALAGIDEGLTREELLERILSSQGEHEDQILGVLISLARPLLDYQFFQLLTSRIEQADQRGDAEHAEQFRALREKILEITQEMDAQVRQQTQERAKLLGEILHSQNPRDAIRAHINEFDDVFMSVLEANIAQSEQERPELAQRFLSIRNLIVEVLEENAPPELRFVSQLMKADYPDETRKMLANNQSMVTPQVLGIMEALIGELENRGDAEANEKLKGILAQAQLMI
jgi:hypothetical protein